jgi:hypothetical protein
MKLTSALIVSALVSEWISPPVTHPTQEELVGFEILLAVTISWDMRWNILPPSSRQ